MWAIETIVRFHGKGWTLSVEDIHTPRLVLRQESREGELNWSITANTFSVDLPEDLLKTIIDNAAEIQKAMIPSSRKYEPHYSAMNSRAPNSYSEDDS